MIRRAVACVLVGAAVGAVTPVIAASVVRYARNAGQVDGFHAVGSSTPRDERAGKLLATDRRGRFPDDVIRQAPDAAELGGRPPVAYEPTPCSANVAAYALVPRDATGALAGVAFVHVLAGKDSTGQPLFDCDDRDVTAERVAPGTYEVDFGGAASCSGGAPILQMRTSVTVKSGVGPPLIANTASVCRDGDRMVELVRVMDSAGAPVDATFVITLLGSLPIPPIP